jgi:YggT family protein
MVTDTIIRVITGAIWLETLLIIASVIISWLPIRQWHPLVRALHAVVDPVLRPFRRILPPIAGFDFSPLLAILVLRAISTLVSSLGLGAQVSVLATLVGVLGQLVLAVLLFLALLVGLRLVLSAFKPSPWNPAVRFIDRASDPLVRPFARIARSASVKVLALIALVGYFGLYVVAGFVFASLQRLVA